ncbi:MAG: hypothetical protein OXP12_02985 [Thaumarchaeota archaeon]|nr:hypothetical protein [Nitrososphaerota archaeon]MDE0266336.1 hypothetical protein [Nitrososphaerota archaeon]
MDCDIRTSENGGNDSDDDDEDAREGPPDAYHAFYHELIGLVHRHAESGIALRVKHDAENRIIRLTGPEATPRARAASGLEDVAELAQSTAEHHPYWGLLYHSSEVADAVLRSWNGALTADQVADIRWSMREIESVLDRLARDSARE